MNLHQWARTRTKSLKPQASSLKNSLTGLFFVLQVFLLSSFALLSGCNDGGGSSTSTSTSTTSNTTTTSTNGVDETPVFEGFKYLNTAKGVIPLQQEAALLRIKGINSAKCDGDECIFTFNGREAVFVYPQKIPATVPSLNILSAVNQSVVTPVSAMKQFPSSQNTLHTLSDTSAACPTKTTAIILAPATITIFDEKTLTQDTSLNGMFEYFISQYSDKLKALGYSNVVVKKGVDANYFAFEELTKQDYGLVIILTHGSKEGHLLMSDFATSYGSPIMDDSCTKDPSCRQYFSTDIVKGLDSGIYSYFGVAGQPFSSDGFKFKSTFFAITPKWWALRNIAAVSTNRFYMFGGCSVFNDKKDSSNRYGSGLLDYFESNKLNGVGFRYNVNSKYFYFFNSFLKRLSDKSIVDALSSAESEYRTEIPQSADASWTNGKVGHADLSQANPDSDIQQTTILKLNNTLTRLSPKACSVTQTPAPTIDLTSAGGAQINTTTTPSPAPTTTPVLSGTYSGTKTYQYGPDMGNKYNISMDFSNKKYTVKIDRDYTSDLTISQTGTAVILVTNPSSNPSCKHTFTGTISGNRIDNGSFSTDNCGRGTWDVTKN